MKHQRVAGRNPLPPRDTFIVFRLNSDRPKGRETFRCKSQHENCVGSEKRPQPRTSQLVNLSISDPKCSKLIFGSADSAFLRLAKTFTVCHPANMDCSSENTPFIQRLFAADYALSLLADGKLPHLKHFVFDATFELRRIRESDSFAATDRTDLLEASSVGGYITVSGERSPRVSLFYESNLTEPETLLYARSVGQLTAVTYAAVGLDMRGILAIDELQVPTTAPPTDR